MFRAYFRSKPWASRAYGGAAAILVLLLAQLQVALTINHLNKRFYDVWADPGRHYLSEAYTALLPFLWTGLLLVGIGFLVLTIRLLKPDPSTERANQRATAAKAATARSRCASATGS